MAQTKVENSQSPENFNLSKSSIFNYVTNELHFFAKFGKTDEFELNT